MYSFSFVMYIYFSLSFHFDGHVYKSNGWKCGVGCLAHATAIFSLWLVVFRTHYVDVVRSDTGIQVMGIMECMYYHSHPRVFGIGGVTGWYQSLGQNT